jgi:site-specific DNA-adenine methylase
MRYGIPYVGSKNKIAEKIIDKLPPAKHFYDLFGGGGAMTHCALLSGKYKYVHYNEFNPLVFKAFKMAVNGEFEDETRWISREDFEKLKNTDPYVAICFSFGNNLKTYAYNKECEKFKKAVHYSIFFNDNSLLNKYIDLKDFKYSSEKLKERRLELQRFLTVLLRENKLERKVYVNFNSVGNARNVIENPERLERLERFMSFNPSGNVQNLLQNMNRLEHIPQISNKVILTNLSYEQVFIESDSIIYCDPPYINTNTYIDDFNHEKFYEWLRDCREKNQQVFISEYQMPNDFHEVFSIKKRISFSQKQNTQKLEKLFVNNGHKFAYTQNNLF